MLCELSGHSQSGCQSFPISCVAAVVVEMLSVMLSLPHLCANQSLKVKVTSIDLP